MSHEGKIIPIEDVIPSSVIRVEKYKGDFSEYVRKSVAKEDLKKLGAGIYLVTIDVGENCLDSCKSWQDVEMYGIDDYGIFLVFCTGPYRETIPPYYICMHEGKKYKITVSFPPEVTLV
jgi:hypothetical protein